eukprot:scaffold4824_cov145-Isochrysis_galbana.AAC.5
MPISRASKAQGQGRQLASPSYARHPFAPCATDSYVSLVVEHPGAGPARRRQRAGAAPCAELPSRSIGEA